MPVMLGWGALTSVVLAAYDYTGSSSLKGFRKDREDEFERKETLRKNRRRPMEETIAEIGEGRCELLSLDPSRSINCMPDVKLTFFSNPAAWIRGAEAREIKGEVRH